MTWNTVQEYRFINGKPEPFVMVGATLKQVAFAAMPGSQAGFLACNEQVALLQGARYTGKTLTALMDYLQFCGCGFGAEYKGLFCREFLPDCFEAESLSKIWFPKIHPGASYNHTHRQWSFPGGETFRFLGLARPEEFEGIRGQAYPWIAIDEVADWETAERLQLLLSLNERSTDPRIPSHVRLMTNCYGKGRDWLMEYFHLTAAPQPTIGPLIVDELGPPRRVFTAQLRENLLGAYVRPGYLQVLKDSTQHNLALQRAWTEALWVAPPTSYFDAVDWSAVRIPQFEVPTPGTIRIGLDPAVSDPTAAVFVWESKGQDIILDGITTPTVAGSLYVVAEYYGAIKPNVGDRALAPEVARRLNAICEHRGWNTKILRASGNVCDGWALNSSPNEHKNSYAQDLAIGGVVVEAADKQRAQGAVQMLKLLCNAKPREDNLKPEPGLFICSNCENLLRTLPNMQRDKHDPDDTETGGDDHGYDSLRYFIRRERTPTIRSGRIDTIYKRGVIRA